MQFSVDEPATFLKSAALLTGIVVGIVGLVLTVFLPLYASDSPVDSQVQANASETERHQEADDRERDRMLILLRQALIASCERANHIRANQRLVLRHHPRLRGEIQGIANVDCQRAVP